MSHDTHDRAVFGKNIFAGRTAFITGGTSGINLAIARGLAACGARLALLGRDPGKAERAVEEVSALGPQALALTADVRDFAALDQAVGIAADHLGPLDFVIAGAAGNFIAPAENLSANGFKAVVEIDLMGSFISRYLPPSADARRQPAGDIFRPGLQPGVGASSRLGCQGRHRIAGTNTCAGMGPQGHPGKQPLPRPDRRHGRCRSPDRRKKDSRVDCAPPRPSLRPA